MKLLGSVLILWSAGICCYFDRREGKRLVLLGDAILCDLLVLKSRVCISCIPLPQIIERELAQGLASQQLWEPFHMLLLERKDKGVEACWKEITVQLPSPLDRLLAPLGSMLIRGGEPLERAINETREELTGFLRAERQRRVSADRLTAAFYLSGAGLLILVLV